MKTCLLLAIVFLAFQITAQIKINVNGKNISVKGKNSNSQKGSDGNGNTNIEENSNKNNNAYNFETNPDAPVSVNNNILAGNSCVVIDSRGNMSRKKVYQVVEGGYAIIDANATDWDLRNNANAVRYFAANSVYPDVDFDQFSNDCSPYKEYVRHYLKCYSANHLPSMEVLKGWESNFPEYMLGSVKEAKEHLFKLKSLDSLMKLKYGNLPNFYCKYEENPFIWGQIAEKRDSMISCLLVSSGDGEYGSALKIMIKDVEEAIQNSKSYVNGGDWSVNNDLIGQAISNKSRKERFDKLSTFFNDYAEFAKLSGGKPNKAKDTLNALLDQLKMELQTALPKYKPVDSKFKFRDSGLETIMKSYLKDAKSLTVFKIGLTHDTWQVKKNNIDIPEYKYKFGAMYVKNPSWDHGYCKVLYFTLKQDYLGGGTYGATHVGWYSEDYHGCQ